MISSRNQNFEITNKFKVIFLPFNLANPGISYFVYLKCKPGVLFVPRHFRVGCVVFPVFFTFQMLNISYKLHFSKEK